MASYRKRRNKDGSFSHQFRIRRYGYPLVTKTFERKTDGEAWVQDTESAMRSGQYTPCKSPEPFTLSTVVDLYVRSQSFLRRRSINSPFQTLMWWKAEIGDMEVSKLSKQAVKQTWLKLEQSVSKKTKLPLSNRTLNFYLENLSSCLSHAVEEDLLTENPVLKIKRKSLNNSRERVLSADELKRLLDASADSSNVYLKTALLISLSTGGRRGEVMSLEWNDVNLQTGEVQFRITKNGHPRKVVLGASALSALREHSRIRRLGSDLVFPPLRPRHEGRNHVPWEDLRAPFARACKAANLVNFRWHDLRHSAASFLMMSGASIEEVMKILGHKSASMSWRYAHLDQRRSAELAMQVDLKFICGQENDAA